MTFNMESKFEAKGFRVSELRAILTRRQPTFRQLWDARLRGQMPEIPPLEDVIRETNRIFMQYF
jgi:hypothetical protein